jgi:hypothetical protein
LDDDDGVVDGQWPSPPIRVSWRDDHGSDQVYAFHEIAELRARVAALARLN